MRVVDRKVQAHVDDAHGVAGGQPCLGEDLVRESSVLRHDARIEPLFEGVLSQVTHQGRGGGRGCARHRHCRGRRTTRFRTRRPSQRRRAGPVVKPQFVAFCLVDHERSFPVSHLPWLAGRPSRLFLKPPGRLTRAAAPLLPRRSSGYAAAFPRLRHEGRRCDAKLICIGAKPLRRKGQGGELAL